MPTLGGIPITSDSGLLHTTTGLGALGRAIKYKGRQPRKTKLLLGAKLTTVHKVPVLKQLHIPIIKPVLGGERRAAQSMAHRHARVQHEMEEKHYKRTKKFREAEIERRLAPTRPYWHGTYTKSNEARAEATKLKSQGHRTKIERSTSPSGEQYTLYTIGKRADKAVEAMRITLKTPYRTAKKGRAIKPCGRSRVAKRR